MAFDVEESPPVVELEFGSTLLAIANPRRLAVAASSFEEITESDFLKAF